MSFETIETPGAKSSKAPSPAEIAKAQRARAKNSRADRAFLPAALEIIDTPPSPIQMALIVIICSFFLVALVWSSFSKIDIIAVAQGKIQPAGRVKIIQPLETSRVAAIRAENGTRVRAGDILVELDQTEAAAEESEIVGNLASYKAEAIRRRASAAAVQTSGMAAFEPIAWPSDIPSAIRERENIVYTGDLSQVRAQRESLIAQSVQKKAEESRLERMAAMQDDLLVTLDERVSMKNQLMKTNAGSKADLIDALETLQQQKTTSAQIKGQIEEAKANLAVILRDTERATFTFLAENAQKRAEAERQAADLTEKLVKTRARIAHMVLRSPIDGAIQASALTTTGQIVTAGEEVMRVVPVDTTLEVECYVQNKDIGFIKDNQSALIKIESFPFTRYGTIDATVVRIARDAIPEPDADQAERDPAHPARASGQAGGQHMQNLVFSVILKPDQNFINIDGAKVPLGAGMTVTAEIRTGSRRILEYFFSPLIQMGSEAIRER